MARGRAAEGPKPIARDAYIGTLMMKRGVVLPAAMSMPYTPAGVPEAEVVLNPTLNASCSSLPWAPHSCLQVDDHHYHGLWSYDPVWRIPGEARGTTRVRLRGDLSVALKKVLDIWAIDKEKRGGKRSYRFSIGKAIMTALKSIRLTTYGKRKILVAYLYTALISRVDPERQGEIIDGLRQRNGGLSSIFCASFTTRMLQVAWLWHEAKADLALKEVIEPEVDALTESYAALIAAKKPPKRVRNELNKMVWKSADGLLKAPDIDVFAEIPTGLRINAGSALAGASVRRLLESVET